MNLVHRRKRMELEKKYFPNHNNNTNNDNSNNHQQSLSLILCTSLYQPPSLKAFRFTHAPSNIVTVIPVVCIALFICTALTQLRLLFYSSSSSPSSLMTEANSNSFFSFFFSKLLTQCLSQKYQETIMNMMTMINMERNQAEVLKLVYLLPWCCNNGLLATLASTYATLVGSLVLHGKVSQLKGAILSLCMAILPILNILYLYQLLNYNKAIEARAITKEGGDLDEDILFLREMNIARHALKDLFQLLFIASS